MKSIKRRIAFHFSLQFIFVILFVAFAFLFLIIYIISSIINNDLEKNFPAGVLDAISSETTIQDGVVYVFPRWEKHLKENEMWLQIIDKKGKAIYSFATPPEIPSSYKINEIIEIEETKRYHDFFLHIQLDTTYDDPYLFIIGYKNDLVHQLNSMAASYGESGLVPEGSIGKVEEKLQTLGGYLHIIDMDGRIVQSIGDDQGEKQYAALEITESRLMPGVYSNFVVHYDSESERTWVLHRLNEKELMKKPAIMKEVIITLLILSLVILILGILFSAWHAFRYGQPLLLFVTWLERMGQGNYDFILTEKDRKKVYNKKGKIKARYRLYREVINAFYDMAEKLDQSVKERTQLEKTREEWMTGISHDLRTPLSTIQGYGHLLESGNYNWTAEELQEMGKTIRDKGAYMLDLVQDFSLSFQLKNNALPLSKKKMNLNQFVHHTVLRFVNDATIKDVLFSFQNDTSDIWIEADERWLGRMLDNLIYNAIKHNPLPLEIAVTVKKDHQYGIVMIKDNGIGMDEETVNNLFERYYRGTNTEEKAEGGGLGMSIAKAIAEAHRGELTVESAIGKGTVITIKFEI
ncbi:HAMP domain-containing histidine kinase [Bacillus aquiflavi]|uniref:histidine kinase n=1 Tax=Bacillus aquiflavi TaxID=2672567 RepID=A0A6B3VWL2_9BACI|nr:HAMP domain-containing sensor histidine kinase [Bacillus aquiflavi]MBA4537115.1 HAMP domain-containing histidine kinase [Bacillus aquiflavi]NEY81412.1 HAMP domain-containing histidine kinase [Bacillus aquiflavi]